MNALKLLLITLLSAALLLPVAQAQSDGSDGASPSRQETVPNTPTKTRDVTPGLLSERVFNRLGRIHEDIGDEKYTEAYAALEELRGGRGLNEYEQAYIVQNMGHVRMSQERYNEAIQLFQQCLDSGALPNNFHFQLMSNLAQIMTMQERYQDSQRLIDEWMEYQTEIPIEMFQLKALNHAELGQHRQAIQAIDRAIEATRTPRENWYQLKLSMHFELKEYAQAAQVLETLIRYWPDKNQYWTQLASIYLELKNEARATSVMALAHRRGILEREAEWLQLFQLYAFSEVPQKAAEILAEGIDRGIIEPTQRRWEDLANSWYSAKQLDNALEAFARASALSTDGKIDLQRGHILIEQERWGEACEALNAAVSKGGLEGSRTGNAYILIGMCEFEQGNRQAARAAFQQAGNYDQQRAAAGQWIRHMDEEAKREEERREREALATEQAASS